MSTGDIRTAVRERYGAIAESTAAGSSTAVETDASADASAAAGADASAAAGADASAHDGADAVAGAEAACCEPSCCGGDAATTNTARDQAKRIGYSEAELDRIPTDSNMGLGCGNPTALAGLAAGEVVLDLGAGGGLDCFLASTKVGPSGRVIGVDMTPSMVELARKNAAEGGYDNVEFRLGEIEALPVADATVDVIISNCVVNLAPDKSKVFAEAFRVLKPGGRLMISDLVSDLPVPDVLTRSVSAVVSCLPVPKSDYLGDLRAAGFDRVDIVEETRFETDHLLEESTIGRVLLKSGLARSAIDRFTKGIRSAAITAVKPA